MLAIGNIVVLHLIKQENLPVNTFKCPLVPLIPCLGIFGNFLLISKVEFITWAYFLIYESLGVAFYFGYGISNSKLNAYFKKKELK